VSGTTLEAQKRYAAGVRESLMNFLQGESIRDDYVMVSDGEIQSGSYNAIYG
jgi:formate dehydrogenase